MFDPGACNCLFCWGAGTAKVGISKKGTPYLSCSNCKSRHFFSSPRALRGYRHWMPDLALFIEKIWLGGSQVSVDPAIQTNAGQMPQWSATGGAS